MAQSGTGQSAHSNVKIFTWATGTTLKAAIDVMLAARSLTWAGVFGQGASMLSMPMIRIFTAAADGVLSDGTATIPITQNALWPAGFPLTVDNPLLLTYTGTSAGTVLMEI